MGTDGWIVVAILVVAGVLFVRRWAPPEVVALAIPVLLAVTGVVRDPLDALQGFGDPAVIALGAIFVVGAGLQGSGLAAYAARGILRASGASGSKVVLFLMTSTALVSGFMNNVAAAALFLPTAVTLSRHALVSPSRLLLPMASAAVLGGTLTVIGTPPNLLVSSYLEGRTGEPIAVFRFAVVGVPIVLTGILYALTIGRKLLPDQTSEDRLREAHLPEELAQSYGVARNLCRMKVMDGSAVAGSTIADAKIRDRYGLSVVLVHRRHGLVSRYLDPKPDLPMKPGDLLYVEGSGEAAWRFAEEEGLQFALAGPQAIERILGRGQTLAEVSIPPRSPVFGRSLRDLRFRARYGLNVISLWRQGKLIENPAGEPLEAGDALLVSGPTTSVRGLARDPDYIVLTDQSETVDVRRAPLALLLLVVAVVPPIVGLLPLAISTIAAGLLMILTGCVGPEEARRAIEWKVVFLIAATLPLGAALEETGVASTVARVILGATSPFGVSATLAGLFFLASAIAVTSSNSAAAVILAPIAAEVAAHGTVDLSIALLAVAYGCSCTFILPLAQSNLIVMGPGGYRARDYLRFGGGLSLVMAATTIALLTLLAR
jgi:di/tricarboxylate transporter